MRRLIVFFISFCSITLSAQKFHEQTSEALQYIYNGYIQYGYNELKKCAIKMGWEHSSTLQCVMRMVLW